MGCCAPSALAVVHQLRSTVFLFFLDAALRTAFYADLFTGALAQYRYALSLRLHSVQGRLLLLAGKVLYSWQE